MTDSATPREQNRRDLLAVPVLSRFLHWRHSSTVMRTFVLLVALVMLVHGLAGPRLAPKNLATVLTWLHFRGLLVLGLLLVGNLFCMACPFVLVRDLARKVVGPRWTWPRRLRNRWLGIALTILLLFSYELFDLWAGPRLTAVLILIYFAGAILLGVVYRGSPFCSHLCPLGQFSLVASLVSPLEVSVRDRQVCDKCSTRECTRGGNGHPGCEFGIFQPKKLGNMNCHFRFDCLRACPYENVGLHSRLPGSELWLDPVRSAVGRFSQRTDLAALVVVFTFGALLNAFGMVTPVYQVEAWLSDLLFTGSEALVLGILFVAALVIAPSLLLSLAAALTRWFTASRETILSLATRYSYGLVPVGFGVWAAHFSFHFLTGALTIVPLVQSLLVDAGWAAAGPPRWDLGPIVPPAWLFPLEVGMMSLGWLGSLLVTYRIADREHPDGPWQAFLPWAGLLVLLLAIGVWLMAQPMEMRGTFLEP